MWLLLRLKRPYDKTPAVWIGSRRHSHVKFFRLDLSLCWNPGIFKVFGVHFSTDVQRFCGINSDKKLEEIKSMLRVWSERLAAW